MSSSLDETTDALELGREQLELWQEIYKLGVSGVDKYIELPQIVVVGDQSSGKSSVLEAMTGVPFPRGSGMCTKFPTQIKLRKSAEKGFFASLIPDVNRSPADRERFARFTERVVGETDLAVILKLAEKTIWPHDNSSNLPSKDVLNLEFSGPKKPYLTVVDLPGIIHVPTGDQTQADLASIRDLAIDSMKNGRTIICAVVSAQNDVSNQIILDMVRQVDPEGHRTLGIITKPDRSESKEQTELFLKLALNQNVKLDLGWHVLRNRSSDEKGWSSEQRDENEREFFRTSNWKVLDKKDVGIESLLSKVSKLLLRRFAEVVPHVVSEIERKLEETRKGLDDLGEGSGTILEMRAKLSAWCKVSKDYVYNAAEGYYRDQYRSPFFDTEIGDGHRRKLRARIDLENERFEEDLRNFGHTIEIFHGQSSPTDYVDNIAEGVNPPRRMTRADFIATNIEPVLLESTGKELRGDSNPLLVYKMFEKQSRNWDKLATRHMAAIERICEEFLYEVLDSVWPGIFQDRVWSAFIEEPLDDRRGDANKELERLCRDRSRYAKSYDQEFTEGVKRWEGRFQVIENTGSDDAVPTFHPLTLGERYLAKMLSYYEVCSAPIISCSSN
jgi:GTPase SAR1 family protein